MVRQWACVMLLLVSLGSANGKEAEAANEDVPRGPGIINPQGNTPTTPTAPTKPAPTDAKGGGGNHKGVTTGSTGKPNTGRSK
jgi:hypothetical protein